MTFAADTQTSFRDGGTAWTMRLNLAAKLILAAFYDSYRTSALYGIGKFF
jgi:hypothetical protein